MVEELPEDDGENDQELAEMEDEVAAGDAEIQGLKEDQEVEEPAEDDLDEEDLKMGRMYIVDRNDLHPWQLNILNNHMWNQYPMFWLQKRQVSVVIMYDK